MTETKEITESTSTEVLTQFTVVCLSGAGQGNDWEEGSHEPIVTPFTLPLITTVVFLHPYKLMIWLISPFSTVSPGSFSWYSYTPPSGLTQAVAERAMRTIIHFFPSRTNLAGFLVESDWGFAGLVGFLAKEVLPGTVEAARKAGFLCVISLFSTFRSPFVTSAPRLSSANTAATPSSEAGACTGAGGGRGEGGLYSLRGIP